MKPENFHERMQRLLLLAPLYHLRNRKITSVKGTELSKMELGLLALLYFFEGMLAGRTQNSRQGLALWLRDVTENSLFATEAEYLALARELVEAFRPASGRRSSESFYNWETGAADAVQFSYLKAAKADLAAGEQYYTLDEQGLELIFATKEFFSEYQLSINQLILRKQLEKGQFALSLRQIEEMRLDVESIRERIRRIRGEIHRSIVSEETLARYQKIIDDINTRLVGEEKEFVSLKDFVHQTKERARQELGQTTSQQAYESILQVERRLELVHHHHSELLQMGIELGTSALTAAEESLYYTGLDALNFEQELTARLFAVPLPVGAARRLAEPFLPLAATKVWSPAALLFPQRLERTERHGREEEFPDLAWEDEHPEQLQELQEAYALIGRRLLEFLGGARLTRLSLFLPWLADTEPQLAASRQSYLFWLLLHRRQTLLLQEAGESARSVYHLLAQGLTQLRELKVTEDTGVVQLGKFSLSEMTVEVKLDGD